MTEANEMLSLISTESNTSINRIQKVATGTDGQGGETSSP